MNRLSDYFLTNQKVCTYENIKYAHNYSTSQQSILNTYKNSIKNNLRNHKINTSIENNELLKLNSIFENYKETNNTDLFCYELIKYKSSLKNKKSQFQNFNKINNSSYLNPLYEINIDPYTINDQLKNFQLNSDYNQLLVQLDLLYFGKYMNHNLISLGIIQHKFSQFHFPSSNILNQKLCTLSNFLENINYYIDNQHLSDKIILPIQFIQIKETLLSILLENVSKINNISKTKQLIVSNIEKISFSMTEILKKPNTKKYAVNELFIIPFQFHNNKLEKLKKTSEIKKYSKDIKAYVQQYKNLKEFFKNNFDDQDENIANMKYSEEVLYLLLHLHIQLVYQCYNTYIDKLTSLIHQFSISSNSDLQHLNFKKANKFIENLTNSTYKFKLILLNNMMNLFLPNNVSNNFYGLDLMNQGYYVLKSSSFLNDHILKKYPLFRNRYREDLLSHFIIQTKNKHDYYDKREILELGTYYCYNKYIHSGLTIFSKYFDKFQHVIQMNMILINYLKKYFEKCTLIENLKTIMNNYSYITSKNLDTDQQKYLETILYQYFKENLEKSSKAIIKIIMHKKLNQNYNEKNKNHKNKNHKNKNHQIQNNHKQNNYKQNNYKQNNHINKLSNEQKEIELLKSKLYYVHAHIIFKVIEYILVNIDLKNKLIQKCSILEKDFTKIIRQKSK